jgi:hypothetical protein
VNVIKWIVFWTACGSVILGAVTFLWAGQFRGHPEVDGRARSLQLSALRAMTGGTLAALAFAAAPWVYEAWYALGAGALLQGGGAVVLLCQVVFPVLSAVFGALVVSACLYRVIR